MSIPEFISKLDYDQLENAINLAKERQEALTARTKIKLWEVADSWMNYAYFHNKENAIQYVVKNQKEFMDDIYICSRKVVEEEYKDMIKDTKVEE